VSSFTFILHEVNGSQSRILVKERDPVLVTLPRTDIDGAVNVSGDTLEGSGGFGGRGSGCMRRSMGFTFDTRLTSAVLDVVSGANDFKVFDCGRVGHFDKEGEILVSEPFMPEFERSGSG
jgi:hypothetical protein